MTEINQNEAARLERRRERFERKMSHTTIKYLRELEDLGRGNTPEAMKPFFDVLKSVYFDMEPVRAEGRPCIGTYCAMVPLELIYAAGAVPVKLCSGNYTSFLIGDDIVPRDACPLVKAVAGFQEMKNLPIYNDCRMMVVPITCDCKKKISQILSRDADVFVMQIPVNREDDEAIDSCVIEYNKLLDKLEQITGANVSCADISHAIALVGNAQYEMSRFLEFKTGTRSLIRGSHVMAMMNAASYMPIDIWTEKLHLLNDELRERQKNGLYITKENQPRIMLTGSPVIFPNIKLPLLIEQMGGSLAADETCMGERFLYDPVIPTEKTFDGLLKAIANRYVRACTCPVFSENRQRVDRILHMIKEHKIQGVIYHVLRGCLVYDYEYAVIEKELKEADIPVIRVENDYNEEDIEQLRIRVEAFIELIKEREYE